MLSFVHVIHMRSVLLGSRHFSLVLFGFIGVWNVKLLSCVFLSSNLYIMFSLARLSCVVVLCSTSHVFIIGRMLPCCNVLWGCPVGESLLAACLSHVLFVPCASLRLNPAHYLTWFICPTCSSSLPPILLLFILPVFSVLCQIVG